MFVLPTPDIHNPQVSDGIEKLLTSPPPSPRPMKDKTERVDVCRKLEEGLATLRSAARLPSLPAPPVLLLRHRRLLTVLLYAALLAAAAYLLYDPELVMRLVLPAPANRVQDASPGEADDSFYSLLGVDFQPAPKPEPARLPHLPFVPRQHKCGEMFHKSGHNFTYSEFYWEHADSYKSALALSHQLREANIDDVSWIFHDVAMQPFIETVCETGFRAGHYSFHWLTGKPEIIVYSFEANDFNFTEDIATFMTSEFPDRFYFFPGDTASTIPKFHEKNNDTRCDLMFVDPTRKTEEQISQDLDNFKVMRHPTDNLVVAISYRSGERGDMGAVWRQKVASGEIVEQFVCSFDPLSPEQQEQYINFNRNDMTVDSIYVGSFTGK